MHFGTFILLVVPALSGISFKEPNLTHLKPFWLLRCESLNSSGVRQSAALWTLWVRLREGKLSDAQAKSLVRDALRMQSDLGRRWNYLWGMLVESAQPGRHITDEQWTQYW